MEFINLTLIDKQVEQLVHRGLYTPLRPSESL